MPAIFFRYLKRENIFPLVLIVSMAVLRLVNLGYSDYVSDEPGTFFYRGGTKNTGMSPMEFMLNERKGPLQLFVGLIPYVIVGDYNNEFAQRLPFTVFSIFSVVAFYYLIVKLTKRPTVAFVGAFLFGVNGLIVGYGRIAQYQNLNTFFSFAALYFWADLLEKKKSLLLRSVLGTVMFGLSLLAHWDALYILIPAGYIFVRFLLNKDVSWTSKLRVFLVNAAIGYLVLFPFMLPYVKGLFVSTENIGYANRIIGLGAPFSRRKDLAQFNLYNPFLTYYLYLVAGLLGIVFSRKNPIFSIWFVVTWLVFRFFIKYSGLHFFNIFIPLTVLVGFTFDWFIAKARKWRKAVPILVLVAILVFLYVQSHLIFVDHKKGYPWEREKVLFFDTSTYTHEDDFRHKMGFPHKRYWKLVNAYVNEQNRLNNEDFGYITNEHGRIAQYYMDADYRNSNGYYAIGVKKPYNFANDYKFPQIKNKKTVHRIKGEGDQTVVQIFRVEPE